MNGCIIYNKYNYADYNFNNKFLIANFYNKEFKLTFKLYLNSFDQRGYMTILRLFSDNINDTYNRPYTFDEVNCLYKLVPIIRGIYQDIGLIPQVYEISNTSQYFSNNNFYIGKELEPSMLNIYFVGRGDPSKCYISDIPLEGPIPGQEFSMREGKLPYNEDYNGSDDKKMKEDEMSYYQGGLYYKEKLDQTMEEPIKYQDIIDTFKNNLSKNINLWEEWLVY